MSGWALAWTIARRELSARFRGLRLLLVCLFLGVGALAAIGSLTQAITGELAGRGQTLLGGDVEFEVSQRSADAAELAAMQRIGRQLLRTIAARRRPRAQIVEVMTVLVVGYEVDAGWRLRVHRHVAGVDRFVAPQVEQHAAKEIVAHGAHEAGRHSLATRRNDEVRRIAAEALQILAGVVRRLIELDHRFAHGQHLGNGCRRLRFHARHQTTSPHRS